MADERRSFILYFDYSEYFNLLTLEDRGMLITAIFDYQCNGTVPNDLPPTVKMAFSFIRNQFDRDAEKYANRCAKNRENGRKGGRPKKQLVYGETERLFSKPTQSKKSLNDTEDDTEKENNNTLSNESVTRTRTKKHKYGEYGHVLLSDTDYQKLHDEYSNADEAIAFLDEYIEYKGYTAKNHYLAMKKWVFDALKERKGQNNESTDNTYAGYDFGITL